MRRKVLSLLLIAVLLCGCATQTPKSAHQCTYVDIFDTVTTIHGYENSAEVFRAQAQKLHDALLEYHRLFDIYNDYPGVNNIKTINDQAGIAPVPVDGRIIRLLLDCRDYYALTEGRVNVAMGSVLHLWHEKREEALTDPEHAELPDMAQLQKAAEHCSFDTVIIDKENSTVFIADPLQRLDVGAVAKGWSAQRAREMAPEGYLIDLGCNICVTGPKPDGKSWRVGIQSPYQANDYLCAVPLSSGCTVTSGDYWRYFEIGSKRYHHIIDPNTLMPADLWRSVTIVCDDSGLADCLSTALFQISRSEGESLLARCGAEAMWADADGQTFTSTNFPKD